MQNILLLVSGKKKQTKKAAQHPCLGVRRLAFVRHADACLGYFTIILRVVPSL